MDRGAIRAPFALRAVRRCFDVCWLLLVVRLFQHVFSPQRPCGQGVAAGVFSFLFFFFFFLSSGGWEKIKL